VVREGARVALLSLGTRLGDCLKAADELAQRKVSVTVADARFAKPIDQALVRQLLADHELVVTVEEGSIGGFGSQVQQFALEDGLLDGKARLRSMILPDQFIDHGTPAGQLAEAGLDSAAIARKVMQGLGMRVEPLRVVAG
jgi:1-deoxy-D-xylulose-5-phosphate synthase